MFLIIWAYVICVVYTVIWLEYKTLNEQTREATCKNYLHFVSVFNDILYLFVHISRAITASFDYHRVWWHGIRTFFLSGNDFRTERHMLECELSFYWNCSKLFAEKMLARQCVWREHPHICLHGCEMQLTKYSAIIRINLSELKKILKEQSTKHGMPSVHIFEWLHQIIKKIHSGAYCCCNFVSFTQFFLSNNCHNRLMYKVVIRLIERNLYYSVCLSYALSRLFCRYSGRERKNEWIKIKYAETCQNEWVFVLTLFSVCLFISTCDLCVCVISVFIQNFVDIIALCN